MDPVKAAIFALLFVLDISEPVEVVNAVSATALQERGGCSCDSVEIVSTRSDVVKKHSQLLGRYNRLRKGESSANPTWTRTAYQHFSGRFFLYYNDHSQGFWAVGETINADVVRLENQGDAECPYRMKSLWRFADGDLNALVYDISMQVVCLDDPCSVANCGHRALCLLKDNKDLSEGKNSTSIDVVGESAATCECEAGFYGNPYERCFPEDEIDAKTTTGATLEDCQCQRLLLSTQNSVALAKHHNSYGEYFLFGGYDGAPVYQHFAGVEYLYRKDGNWLISDEIGLREAGLQNQGDALSNGCPYRFRTTWEYADVEQPGWQWVYDYTARLVCPKDFCSVTKCGFHASCREENNQGVCRCDEGYGDGNPYLRCFPKLPRGTECDCKELVLTSIGASALAQADKMGVYYLYAIDHNGRPAYQHKSGLDYLFYAEGNAWVIGAQFGGSRVGIVNFDRGSCPYNLSLHWRHSVGGKLQTDESLSVVCNDYEMVGYLGNAEPISQTTTTTTTSTTKSTTTGGTTSTSPPTSTITPTTTGTTSPISTERTQLDDNVPEPSADQVVTVLPEGATQDSGKGESEPRVEPTEQSESTTTAISIATSTTPSPIKFDTTCTCPEIVISSERESTVAKHGSQMGAYSLHGAKSGRPVYKHKERQQYLYYHPYSGGNWLINSEVGLLYGGIQNSKDFPLCPYLINTVWQYGDSELGGWVYDSSLRVTCPSDPCSVLKCGFRAQCKQESKEVAHCACRPGFSGDPRVRCFPDEVRQSCPCLHLRLGSTGQAREHQRDKMGDFFLWGYYNARPVFQHSSGLDFLYFHKNNVWGVGPKIGGNSAGLLNFGTHVCPYSLWTPWEFGTKDRNKQRQVDPQLKLVCVDDSPNGVTPGPTLTLQRAPPQQPPPPPPPPPPTPPAPLIPPSRPPPLITGRPTRPPKTTPPPAAASIFGLFRTQPPIEPKQPQPSQGGCGLRQVMPVASRLLSPVGDKSAKYGSIPWHAQIAVEEDENRRAKTLTHLCSGVIVSNRYVLTAASCLTDHPLSRYRIVVGQNELSPSYFTEPHESTFTAQSVYIHDHYDGDTKEHDLALVKTKDTITFGSHVAAACLPKQDFILDPSALCEVSSWRLGSSRGRLQASAVPVVQDPCTTRTRNGNEGLICAGTMQHDMECAMDSGSPLVCTVGDRSTVSGVLSSAADECRPGRTNGFLRIAHYSDWISSRLNL